MRLVVAVVIALAGVAHADTPDVDVPGRESTELRGDAAVWEDATFYLEPAEGSTAVRFYGGARDDGARTIPVKIVGARLRDFVEVEITRAPACMWRRATVDERVTGLHLYVKRTDLAPVLIKPFAIAYRDGTRVRVQAGVPAIPTERGTYVVSARGYKLTLPIPHASVGYTYRLGRVVEPPLPKGPLWGVDYGHTVRLGDNELQPYSGWVARTVSTHDGTTLLAWSTRCFELVVSANARSVRKASRPGVEIYGSGRGGAVRLHTIPRGTPLSTIGGREVALAAAEIDVEPPVDGKACFDATFQLDRLDHDGSNMWRSFRLCAPADVVDGPPVPPRTAGDDPLAAPPDVAAPPSDAQRTAKGVFYKRLVRGKSGKRPKASSTVLVHYTGWTTDGKMFDSTHQRSQPARFPLTAVIAGWTDGLQTMVVGDKTRFWIPEELAYQGRPGPPAGMLVFDVELLSVE
jgi:hypothetical protein